MVLLSKSKLFSKDIKESNLLGTKNNIINQNNYHSQNQQKVTLISKNNYYLYNLFALILILVVTLILSLSPKQAQAKARNEIVSTKFSNKYGELRITFELAKFPKYRVFTAKNPNRLVIDFQDSQIIQDSKLDALKNELFASIKTGLNSHSDLRVTIGLNKKFQIVRSIIINPEKNQKNYRLVVILNQTKDSSSQNEKNVAEIVSNTESPLNSKIADKIISKTDNETGTVTYIIKKKTANKKRIPVIIIDAGHGGRDPGTIGNFARTKEKDITLDYALELKKELDKTKQFKIFLTRNSDYFLTLSQRVEKARRLDADLFVSLHVNSASNKEATGLSVYTLSEKSSDKQAEILAQKENKSDIIGGVDFSGAGPDILETLIDLSQRDSMNNSAKFAQIIIETSKQEDVSTLQNTHRFAGFKVLTAPDMASVLIELGYLSNKEEEKILNKTFYKRKLIRAVSVSIENYFKQLKTY